MKKKNGIIRFSVLYAMLVIIALNVDAQKAKWQESFYQLDWLVCGRFPNNPESTVKGFTGHKKCWGYDNDFLKEHGGEAAIVPTEGMTHTFKGEQHSWEKINLDEFPVIDFSSLFKQSDNSVAYAYCEVVAPNNFGGIISLGSDDGVKVWLNGKLVHENHQARAIKHDEDIKIVQLKKGTNRFLVKVDNDAGSFGFVMRVGVDERQKVKIMESAVDDCDGASTGLVALTDLGKNVYKGATGGLYLNGANKPPKSHLTIGKKLSKTVQPLDTNGLPSEQGKIILVSFGMSNTTMEFSAFVKAVGDDKNTKLEIVDGAVGGKDVRAWADPDNYVWQNLLAKLKAENLSPNQVQVAWSKHAIAGASGSFPESSHRLQMFLEQVAQNAIKYFPNMKLIFWSSRIYAGYATVNLNPEPYAYQSGFAVKWMIEKQIAGDASLSINDRKTSWLGWGPYLWADGLTPREEDGLIWKCSDLRKGEGTHPSPDGCRKVAILLEDFFRTNELSSEWFNTK